MSSHKHQVLVIGAGSAGITVAASLRRRAPRLDIALVEPSAHHYYQPAFTLVGAGQYSLAATRRDMRSLIPGGVKLIPAAVTAFRPQANSLDLDNGDSCSYDWLVVATGIGLDLERIEGLREALGANGVCSNYSPAYAEYTWRCVQDLQAGARAVFTQPPLPFKCPGAPQKAAYLSADLLHRAGKLASSTVEFYAHGPAIFGVPYFARELAKVAARYNISTNFQHNLVCVDGPAKRATFEIVGGERQGERIEVGFDMLHVSPPQSPPAVVKDSELANAAGWVEVDQNNLRHTRFANIFSLGDVCSTPNSKTAAAVRKQAPVVVRNLLHAMAGRELEPGYDGYASCPLTTAIGKCIMAEFTYGGKVTPTLPLNPARERRLNWWIKRTGLPLFYWHYMLKGYERFLPHNTAFTED